MSSRDYVYVQNPCGNGAYDFTYLIYLVQTPDYKSDDPRDGKCRGEVFPKPEFEAHVRGKVFEYVELIAENGEDLQYLSTALSESVERLDLKIYRDRDTDLTGLESLKSLEDFSLFDRPKLTKLWDVTKNPNLKKFWMSTCNRVHDLSMFANSSVESLKIFGCDGLSSLTSQMHVDDLSFLLQMPKLKILHLSIVKDREPAYYLKLFAQLKNLDELMLEESFFTFKQNAWLLSKLPEVKGLEPTRYFAPCDSYSIIGYRKPRFLKDKERAKKYESEYFSLVEKYKNIDEPPVD